MDLYIIKLAVTQKDMSEKKNHSNGQTTAIIRMELTILEKTWTRMHSGFFFFFFSSTNKRRSHNPTNPTSIVDQILELLKKKKSIIRLQNCKWINKH